MHKFFLLLSILLVTGCDEAAMFQVNPPLEPPEPVIQSGTDIRFVAEPNGSIRVTKIQSTLHTVETSPDVGLGRDLDHARNPTTGEIWVNISGQWLSLNGPRP